MLLSYSSNIQALSTQTANTIEGSAPYLLLTDGVTKLATVDDLLSFTMPKRDGSSGSEHIDTSMVGTVLIAPKGMKYSDVLTLVIADGSLHNITRATVGDDDGDAAIITDASITGMMKATWYNGGMLVSDANLNQQFTDCGGPYTLKIEIPIDINVNTKYGAPNSRFYGSHTGVTYTFASNSQGICFIQPQNLKVYTGTAGYDIKYATGYNPIKWKYDAASDTHKGFKAGAGFPTTGFQNAVFNVIASGDDQKKFRCRSTDDGGKITLSGNSTTALGEKCKVTYNSSKMSEFTAGGTPTIVVEYNTTGSTWEVIDSYKIPTPQRWSIGKGLMLYGDTKSLSTSTDFYVLDTCRLEVDGSNTPATTTQQAIDMTINGKAWRQKYLFRREEMSNSPYASNQTYPEPSAPTYVESFFSRDVDGTFMGEWGYVHDYVGSGWAGGYGYWSAEARSTAYQIPVRSYGDIYVASPIYTSIVAICRG